MVTGKPERVIATNIKDVIEMSPPLEAKKQVKEVLGEVWDLMS